MAITTYIAVIEGIPISTMFYLCVSFLFGIYVKYQNTCKVHTNDFG